VKEETLNNNVAYEHYLQGVKALEGISGVTHNQFMVLENVLAALGWMLEEPDPPEEDDNGETEAEVPE
jgi:hypothetical protein